MSQGTTEREMELLRELEKATRERNVERDRPIWADDRSDIARYRRSELQRLDETIDHVLWQLERHRRGAS